MVLITDTLEPAWLEVTPGTTITWRNDDDERHRIRARDGPARFDSGNLEPGQSFSFSFVAEGTYAYLDERDKEDAAYHGTIVVATTVGEGGAGDPAPASGQVSIVDRSFQPPDLRVASGGTVSWSNDDTEGHTVTALDGAFDSGLLAEGASFSTTLDTPGTHEYFCAIHPEMRGSLTVTDAATTPAPAGGG